jgi:hypothetical protein
MAQFLGLLKSKTNPALPFSQNDLFQDKDLLKRCRQFLSINLMVANNRHFCSAGSDLF